MGKQLSIGKIQILAKLSELECTQISVAQLVSKTWKTVQNAIIHSSLIKKTQEGEDFSEVSELQGS